MSATIERFAMAAAAGIDTSVFNKREAEKLEPILITGIITIAIEFIKSCQQRKNPDAGTVYENAQASYDEYPVASRNQVKHMVMRAGRQKGIRLSGETAREFADSIIGNGLQLSQEEVTEFCTAA